MLSAAVDLTFDGDDWKDQGPTLFYRAASVNSWGVTSIGRGFDWTPHREGVNLPIRARESVCQPEPSDSDEPHLTRRNHGFASHVVSPYAIVTPTDPIVFATSPFTAEPLSISPVRSPPRSPSPRTSVATTPPSGFRRYMPPRSPSSPSSPRPRRRSSQQRVSLVAGRVLIAPMEPPSTPPLLSTSLHHSGNTNSLASTGASTGAPSPFPEKSFLGARSISEFVIEGEIGRGAYGLVKRGKEIESDGSLGPSLIIKQIIKSRILADCWKKHPSHGTIPIEIYVMSAISSTSYVLPPRRPWDPSRHYSSQQLTCYQHPNNAIECNCRLESDARGDDTWIEGSLVKGHPNICPLLDFFEDDHYYYLILPSITPVQQPGELPPPTDLFDLVESYPQGLPSSSVRSYLGQMADALSFLHARGIVHRDVKDENVVLGAGGRCILIDFGSSGLVRKHGWDTFSGTLDYAGPEILRGERYYGKEQDVWAFGVVGYVLLTGECPFMTSAEAQEGLESPFANASIALDERCADGKEREGEEADGGGALGDAAGLVRACLQVEVSARPSFEQIIRSRFLSGSSTLID